MVHRKLTSGQKRILAYRSLLEMVARRDLPWVCSDSSEIEALLALHGAGLIVGDFERPTIARDGSKHIPRAVIKGLTTEGRSMLRDRDPASARMGSMRISLATDSTSTLRARHGPPQSSA